MLMLKKIYVLFGLILVPWAICHAQDMGNSTLTVHTPYSAGVHTSIALQAFIDNVNAAPDVAPTLDLQTDAAEFGNPEMFRAIRTGRAPFGEILMANLANIDPIFYLDNVPFLANDFESARLLWQASRATIEESLHDQGIVLLYAVPWPPQGLFTQKPITAVEDLADLRLRAYSPATTDLALKLNTQPVQTQTHEIPDAFMTARIDAMITSSTMGVSTAAWRFTEHYTNIPSWLPKNILMMNKRIYDALSPNAQTAIRNAAMQAETLGWQLAEDSTENMINHLAAQGLTISTASPELTSALFDIGLRMAVEWTATGGLSRQRVLEEYYALLAGESAATTYADQAEDGFYVLNDHEVMAIDSGLIWSRCSLGQRWDNNGCQGIPVRHSWSGLASALEQHNQMTQGNWRLPTKEELSSLIRCQSQAGRAPNTGDICTAYNDRPALARRTFPNTLPRWYWTADAWAEDDGFAWAVDFSVGHQYPIGKFGYTHYVRLVREP